MRHFIALFAQLDAYAARLGLEGVDKSGIPSLWATLKDGWYYIGAFVVLVVTGGVILAARMRG